MCSCGRGVCIGMNSPLPAGRASLLFIVCLRCAPFLFFLPPLGAHMPANFQDAFSKKFNPKRKPSARRRHPLRQAPPRPSAVGPPSLASHTSQSPARTSSPRVSTATREHSRSATVGQGLCNSQPHPCMPAALAPAPASPLDCNRVVLAAP